MIELLITKGRRHIEGSGFQAYLLHRRIL